MSCGRITRTAFAQALAGLRCREVPTGRSRRPSMLARGCRRTRRTSAQRLFCHVYRRAKKVPGHSQMRVPTSWAARCCAPSASARTTTPPAVTAHQLREVVDRLVSAGHRRTTELPIPSSPPTPVRHHPSGADRHNTPTHAAGGHRRRPMGFDGTASNLAGFETLSDL